MMKTVNFKKGQLTIVKIWCSVKNRIPYYIISKFFEFTGTFVSDDLIETATSSIQNSDNVPTFYISNDIPISKDSKICYIDTSIKPWNNLTLENCSMKTLGGKTKEGNSIAFLPIIEYMKQVTEEFPEEIYSKLWNIFIENNLIKPFQNSVFFGMRNLAYEYINANSEQMMIKAMDYIDSINDNLLKDTFQYKYAEIYIKMSISIKEQCQWDSDWDRERFSKGYENAECKKLKYPLYELVEECRELCTKYKCASPFYLMTRLLNRATDGGRWINQYFDILIPKLEDYTSKSECFKKVLSKVYLEKGKFIEKNKNYGVPPKGMEYFEYVEQTKEYKNLYAKSFQCSENYLNAFYVGLMFNLETKQGKGRYVDLYDHAVKYFLKSKELLEVYSKGDMNVVEMRCYFNSYLWVCKIYSELKEYEKVIEYGLEAHRFYENVIKNESLYEKLYGNNVKFYSKAFTSTIAIHRIYEYLNSAYIEKGDMEQAEFFLGLYANFFRKY